jgi:ribose transport system substrate-binding protein
MVIQKRFYEHGGENMKKLLLMVSCLALLTVGVFAGGQSGGGSSKISVGIVMKTRTSPYFTYLANTLRDECQKLGWDVTLLDSNDDTTTEANNMDSLINKKVKLIFMDCIEPDAVVPSINRAADAGIPVINVDSGVGAGSRDVTTVYSDNKENGRAVGIAYVNYIGKDKQLNSILLSGMKGNIAGQERRTGLFAGIIQARLGLSPTAAWAEAEKFNDDLTRAGRAENAAAKFRVLGQGWGNWGKEGGLAAGEDLITANKNVLNLMLAENDEMNLGARNALINAGLLDVDIIAAADGSKLAYDLIKTGEKPRYIATGENSPSKIALKAIEIAKEILVNGKAPTSYPRITLTEAFGVTSEIVDAHYDYGF